MGMKDELIALSSWAAGRHNTRFASLTDEEYLWEPFEDCWTLRLAADGTSRGDHSLPEPDPPPFTTLAWRMWHLIELYGSARNAQWLGVEQSGDPCGDFEDPAPATAAEALATLERATTQWLAHIDAITEEELQQPIGPIGGQYAKETKAAFVYHQLDEVIHHGAEVAMMRDLYRATVTPDESWKTSVLGAAGRGRWDLVVDLVKNGAGVNDVLIDGRTALHSAAAVGREDVVELLLEHGANRDAIESTWNATPLVWAQFFGRDKVVALLS
jgi:uncharacterized damage-inducible protein DinB